jgi:hypothetical protein
VPKGFVSQISDAIESRSKRKRLERDEKCRRMQEPAIAHFRYRAEHDHVAYFKGIVDEYDKKNKTHGVTKV